MTFEDWQKYIDSQFVDDIPQPSESHAPAPNIEGASELHAFVTTDVNNFAVSSPQDFVPRSVEVVEVHKGQTYLQETSTADATSSVIEETTALPSIPETALKEKQQFVIHDLDKPIPEPVPNPVTIPKPRANPAPSREFGDMDVEIPTFASYMPANRQTTAPKVEINAEPEPIEVVAETLLPEVTKVEVDLVSAFAEETITAPQPSFVRRTREPRPTRTRSTAPDLTMEDFWNLSPQNFPFIITELRTEEERLRLGLLHHSLESNSAHVDLPAELKHKLFRSKIEESLPHLALLPHTSSSVRSLSDALAFIESQSKG